MGVFKEEASTFETIARKQTLIYPDAVDYGYAYDTKNQPQEISDLIESINELKSLDKKFPISEFPDEKPMIRKRETWKDGVSVEIRIAWEQENGYHLGTQYDISFNRIINQHSLINRSYDAFISVDISRFKEKV